MPRSTQPPIEWIAPPTPDAGLIDAVHRRHDGFVSLAFRVTETQWLQPVSLPANAIPELFAQVVHELGKDSFFSLQGMWRDGRCKNDYGYVGTDGKLLGKGYRRADAVRWLTCCAVDIDCWARGRTVGQVIGQLIDDQDAGKIRTPPSAILRSGRGVWLLWFLADDHGRPIWGNPRDAAGSRNLEHWNRVQSAIVARFRDWGSDPAARAADRTARIPGSINTKAAYDSPDRRVRYWLQCNEGGKPHAYSLAELAVEFGADLSPKRFVPIATPQPEQHAADRKASSQPLTPNRIRAAKGKLGRWRTALENFRQLWALRGTWREGTRHAAAFVLARIVRALVDCGAITHAQAAAEFTALWADIAQMPTPHSRPEFESTIRAAMTSKRQPKPIQNRTIANMLRITADESAQLKTWPPADGESRPEGTGKLSRADRQERRRQLLAARIDPTAPPTLAAMAQIVEAAGLGTPSPTTLAADLAALGVTQPRRRRPRKPRDTQTRSMFPDAPTDSPANE